MAISHVKSNAVADWTGTVTVFDSQGSTATAAATNLVRPVDWNSGHNQFYTLSGNTNNASTASGTNVVLQGVGAVTLAGSTGTIGISVANPVTHKMFSIPGEATLQNQGQSSLHIQPLMLPNVQHDHIGFYLLFSNNTNSTGSVTISQWVGLYTRNASTLSLLSSTSTSRGHTFSGTGGDFSLQHGMRALTIPWTNTITQGDYWLGVISRTTSGGANATLSQVLRSEQASGFSGVLGVASDNSAQWVLGLGTYSTNTTGIPNSIAFSEIGGNAAVPRRPPLFFLLSQTA